MTIIDQYVDLAKRTESIVLGVNDINLRLLHSAIGLATEIIEFNESGFDSFINNQQPNLANLLEELGDCFWYVAIGCDVLNINFAEVIRSNIIIPNEELNPMISASKCEVIIGNILDICKQHIFYRKNMDIKKIFQLYVQLIQELHKTILGFHKDISIELEKNISKLQVRYPNRYSDYHAINRSLDSEREILER